MMFKTLSDIRLASVDELKAYLTAEKVAFSPEALRDELEADARQHLGLKLGAQTPEDKEVVTQAQEEAVVIEDALTAEQALQQLHARGFKDREEVIAYLQVFEREKAEIKVQRETIAKTIEDIALRELRMTEREKALESQAAVLRADMKKQEDLYERNAKLKESLTGMGVDPNAIQ